MIKMKAFVFLFFLLVVSASDVNACSCAGGGKPCQAFWKASAVFKGTVIDISTTTYKVGERDFAFRLVRFTIDQPFRGVTGSEVVVMTGLGGGDCGYAFRLGGQYIVYAYRDGEKLTTSICGRTRLVSEASEDLAYFEGLATAEPGATISGEVKRSDRAANFEVRPVSDVKIVIEGTSRSIDAITDKQGTYRVSGLAPGTYKVRVELSDGLDIHSPEREVKLFDRGCAEVSFWVDSDTRITGKVYDAEGQPATEVLMELVPVEGQTKVFTSNVKTDKEGRYEMKMVQPGRYMFGVRIYGSGGATYVPYPRTYYPGVSEAAQATVIDVVEGQRLELNDLILQQRFVEATLNGVVVDVNGRPISGATVWLKEREYADHDMPYRKETDSEGRFSFKVYEGINYDLKAYLDIAKGTRKQAEHSLRISSESEILKLVLK